jgi:hypothetical protein
LGIWTQKEREIFPKFFHLEKKKNLRVVIASRSERLVLTKRKYEAAYWVTNGDILLLTNVRPSGDVHLPTLVSLNVNFTSKEK